LKLLLVGCLSVLTVLTPIIVAVIYNPEWFREMRNLFGSKQPLIPQSTNKNIVGRVSNARTGTWISGAAVSLEADGIIPQTRYTDAQGVFEFSFQSSSNKIRIRVVADGYERNDRLIDLSNPEMVDIRLLPDYIPPLK
jgi:hypothetical protein